MSQQVIATMVCHKTSHHYTILRLRDRFGAPRIFPDTIENTEIIYLIIQTVSHLFWIKPREPPTGRCNLREIVKEIRASSKTKSLHPLPKSSLLSQRTFSYLHKCLFFFWWCILYVKQKQIRSILLVQPDMRGHHWFRIGVRFHCLIRDYQLASSGRKK